MQQWISLGSEKSNVCTMLKEIFSLILACIPAIEDDITAAPSYA